MYSLRWVYDKFTIVSKGKLLSFNREYFRGTQWQDYLDIFDLTSGSRKVGKLQIEHMDLDTVRFIEVNGEIYCFNGRSYWRILL